MAAVVADDGGQLEAAEYAVTPITILAAFPGAVKNGSDHNLVPLIEGGKSALGRQIRLVRRAKVTVEVGGCIKSLAERVVTHEGEVIAEALLDLQNAALIKS